MTYKTPLFDWITPYYYPVMKRLFPSLPQSGPAAFHFESHAGFVNDWPSVIAVMIVYYVMVFVHFRYRRPFEWFSRKFGSAVQLVFVVHNAVLVVLSGVLLALILENLVPRILQHGLMWGICHENAFEQDHRLEFFYYVNYLLKYYELLDTALLILKGKRLDFLHWYHHSATLFLAFVQLLGRSSVQWIPVTLNLSVHVIMYYYYAHTAVTRKPLWWKRYLTTMQITQFVLDLVFILVATYSVFAGRFGWPFQFTWGSFGRGIGPSQLNYNAAVKCQGTVAAAFWGNSILISYLMLFLQFFSKTYKDPMSSTPATSPAKKQK